MRTILRSILRDRRRVVLAACTLAAVLGGVLVAQRPDPGFPRSRVGLFEVMGLDFRPAGAWRTRTEAVRAARRGLLGRGALAAVNRPGAPRVSLSVRIPVIPVTFSNLPAPFPAPAYHPVLFDPAPAVRPYSVRSYYAEMSRGLVSIDGVVFDWVTADSSDTYYEDGCNGVGVLTPCPGQGRPFGELLLEALQASDTGTTDWGQFDNDGADGLPNSGDDDGVVDVVLFLHPEVDGACGTSNIWSHRFDLAGWNRGSGYVTRSPVRDAAGQPVPGRFLVIRDYTMQSAVGGADACTAGQLMSIGTVAHETGHAFGLPDLYDTDLRSPGVTQGVGEWSLMGSGNYTQPYSPAGFDAWSLAELGWIRVDSIPEGGVVLDPVATSHTVLGLGVPGTDEYFLFENRQAIGSDTAQLNPECRFRTRACAKAPGLLLWHIDLGQVVAHGFRQDNRVNSGAVHGVALIQADGRNDLRTPGQGNRGDTGDPWPGSTGNSVLGDTTNPAALDNQRLTAGFRLDSIRQLVPGGAVAFHLTRTTPGGVVLSLPWATDELLGRRRLSAPALARLDAEGNRNGRYDTGDYLAYYRTQTITPVAGVLGPPGPGGAGTRPRGID
jgi:M6 family metalloprotease-like protein